SSIKLRQSAPQSNRGLGRQGCRPFFFQPRRHLPDRPPDRFTAPPSPPRPVPSPPPPPVARSATWDTAARSTPRTLPPARAAAAALAQPPCKAARTSAAPPAHPSPPSTRQVSSAGPPRASPDPPPRKPSRLCCTSRTPRLNSPRG